MTIDPALKKSLIVTLIATLIVTLLIEPILRFLWPLFLNFGYFCFKSYLNYLFKISAKGNANFASLDTFLFVLWGILGFMTFFYALSRARLKEILKGYNQRDGDSLEKKIKKIKRAVNFLLVISLLSYLVYFQEMISIAFPHLLNVDFKQNMAALSPYLSEKEEKTLISKWALMKNKDNFEEIKKIMNSYGHNNNMLLPGKLFR